MFANYGIVVTGVAPDNMDKAIQARLTGYAQLAALVSTRIYLIMAEQEETKPYVVYQSEEAESVPCMITGCRQIRVSAITGFVSTRGMQ